MIRTTPIAVAATFVAATALAVAAPLAASAHVTVTPSSTAAASFSVLTFAIGHGCEGSPTTAVTFTAPESVESVTPTVNPGWTITPNGNQVVYTADEPLPDGQRTTFELSVKLPEAPAGERLEFPVLQTCEVGSTDWAQSAVAGEAEPEHPAPAIVITEATGDGHGHSEPAVALEGAAPDSAAPDGAASSDDVIARVLGIAGLVVGTVGVLIGVTARRKEAAK